MHAAALGVLALMTQYTGVGVPGDIEAAVRGEQATIALFSQCPFGHEGPLLNKRRARDPFHRPAPYTLPWPLLM